MPKLIFCLCLLFALEAQAQSDEALPTETPYPYSGILEEGMGPAEGEYLPEEQQFDPEAEAQYLPPAEEIYPEEEYLEEEPYY
jgi:hypothetical protein